MLTKPTSYEEARNVLKGKPAVSRDAFERLAPEIKPYAFCISGVEDAKMLQRVRDVVAEYAANPHAAHWRDAKKEIARELSSLPQFSEEKALRRAELLLRTHGYDALRVGQWELAQETKDTLPYFKYLCTQDERTRRSHRALHGLVLPVDHVFWDKHMPPGWDWNCRCQVVQISERQMNLQKQAEAKLPPERRRVLDEKQAKLLAEKGELWVSPTERIFVNSAKKVPSCKSLRMNSEEILKKFDPTTREIFLQKLESVPVSGVEGVKNAREWFEGVGLFKFFKKSEKIVYSYIESIPEIEKAYEQILKKSDADDKNAVANALKIIELPEDKRGKFKVGSVKNVGKKSAENDTLRRGIEEFERFVNPKLYENIPALDVVFSRDIRPRSALSSRWDSSEKRLRAQCVKFQYGSPKYRGSRTLEGILNEKAFAHEFVHHLENENPELLKRSVDFVLKRSQGKPPRRLKDIYPTHDYPASEKTYEDDYIAKGGNAYSGKEYKFGDMWIATDVLTMGTERLLTNPLKFYKQDKEYFIFTITQLRGAFL